MCLVQQSGVARVTAEALGRKLGPARCCARTEEAGHANVWTAVQALAISSSFRDKLGVADVPGSSYVLNRATNRLEPCTAHTCPYATAATSPAVGSEEAGGWNGMRLLRLLRIKAAAWSGPDPRAAAAPRRADAFRPSLHNPKQVNHGAVQRFSHRSHPASPATCAGVHVQSGKPMLVNRAPYLMGGMVGVVAARNPLSVQGAVFQYLALMASPSQAWANVLDPASGGLLLTSCLHNAPSGARLDGRATWRCCRAHDTPFATSADPAPRLASPSCQQRGLLHGRQVLTLLLQLCAHRVDPWPWACLVLCSDLALQA